MRSQPGNRVGRRMTRTIQLRSAVPRRVERPSIASAASMCGTSHMPEADRRRASTYTGGQCLGYRYLRLAAEEDMSAPFATAASCSMSPRAPGDPEGRILYAVIMSDH